MSKKKKRRVRRGLLARLFAPILVLLSLGLAFQIYKLNILPITYLLPVLLIIVVLSLILFIFSYYKSRSAFLKSFVSFLVVVLTIVYGAGNYYIYKTDELFARIDDLETKVTNTISLRVMKDSTIKDAEGIQNKTVGICSSQDKEGTEKMMNSLSQAGIRYTKVEFDSFTDMTGALYDHEIDAMILNDAYLGLVHDVEPYTFVTTETKSIDEVIYYTERTTKIKDSSDQVNVTQEPFTVLISGNDTYGSLSENSRSDVNMLVTVNPKTGIILMTSIPRDYYLEVDCPVSSACAEGQMDKLTHSGLHGIETTEATLEKALGININYTVRVNFSSLVNLVDALGGVNVTVDEGLAVKTFYANETLEGVKEGINHLDGERALAFARERHAYVDGDAQRVRNQQIVLRAIISKITSPSILLNYGKFIDAVGGAFETDMPAAQIKDLMRYQLATNTKWTFESYSLRGTDSTEYCAELGTAAYVTIPDEYSIEIAKEKLQAVLDGESSAEIEDEEASGPAGTVDQEEDTDDGSDTYSYYPSYDDDDESYSEAYDDADTTHSRTNYYDSSDEIEAYNPDWTLDDESIQD